jgi:hypothetical protein
MTFNFKDLARMYVEALEAYAESMKSTDASDMDHLNEPSVMLAIENPRPPDGSEIEVLPGLTGKVSHSIDEEIGKARLVTAFVNVKCKDIETFMQGIGMKLPKQEEVIVSKLREIIH